MDKHPLNLSSSNNEISIVAQNIPYLNVIMSPQNGSQGLVMTFLSLISGMLFY